MTLINITDWKKQWHLQRQHVCDRTAASIGQSLCLYFLRKFSYKNYDLAFIQYTFGVCILQHHFKETEIIYQFPQWHLLAFWWPRGPLEAYCNFDVKSLTAVPTVVLYRQPTSGQDLTASQINDRRLNNEKQSHGKGTRYNIIFWFFVGWIPMLQWFYFWEDNDCSSGGVPTDCSKWQGKMGRLSGWSGHIDRVA